MNHPAVVIIKKISNAIFSRPRIIVAALIILMCFLIYNYKEVITVNDKKVNKVSTTTLVLLGICASLSIITLAMSNIYTECQSKDEVSNMAAAMAEEQCGEEDSDDE